MSVRYRKASRKDTRLTADELREEGLQSQGAAVDGGCVVGRYAQRENDLSICKLRAVAVSTATHQNYFPKPLQRMHDSI